MAASNCRMRRSKSRQHAPQMRASALDGRAWQHRQTAMAVVAVGLASRL